MAVLVLACSAAFAAASPSGARNALLTYSAPTKFTDNSPIPNGAVLTYRIYRGTSTTTCGTRIMEVTALQVLLTMQPLGRQCYCVSAVLNGAESAPTSPGCKTMRLPAPTEGAIEAPTNGSIER